MSYSRFGDSVFYTFWRVASQGVTETRDNAMFEICPIVMFRAAELRSDMAACLEKVRTKELYSGGLPDDRDIEELAGYMREFLADVDEKYPVT